MARRSRALTSRSRFRSFLQSGAPQEDSEKQRRGCTTPSKLSTSTCVHFLPSISALAPSPQLGQGLSSRAAACPDDGN